MSDAFDVREASWSAAVLCRFRWIFRGISEATRSSVFMLMWVRATQCFLVLFVCAANGASRNKQPTFEKAVAPVLRQYCFECHGNGKHKGGVALDKYKDEATILADQDIWEQIFENVSTHVMPPQKKPQPSEKEREQITAWIQIAVFHCDCEHPDPGRVTIRRLNRVEYNNTIRDLVGVDFEPAADFPADDLGYGFDNIGDVLSMPPVLMERYLAAAERILSKAILTDTNPPPRIKRYPAHELSGSAPGGPVGGTARGLNREGDIYVDHEFPEVGEYIFRARAWGEQAGNEPPRMALRLEGKDLKVFDVSVEQDAPALFETKCNVTAGKKRFSAAYLNNFVDPKNPDPRRRDRNLIIEFLEIVAPPDLKPLPYPETHKHIFTREPTPKTKYEAAREIIGNFARRAYRRPLSEDELFRLVKLFDLASSERENFAASVKLALKAVLVSPHFLFRGELQSSPDDPSSIQPIGEYALASRLSYFLWSTMPDDELLAEAEHGILRRNLEKQVKRMLADSKAHALVDNFAGQWLQTRNLAQVAPDKKLFPDFDENLRSAMQTETAMFFEGIMKEDRSVLEFVDANYTFVNEQLAKHYGISGVKGEEFQRVSLKGTQHGGVLSQAAILTLTSNPTRTSPVKRGKWVLENILGTPPPPPPPNVPELKEHAELTGTLRERMEQHRADPICAGCHARMDPIGFSLENYDAIGRWRDKDADFEIDPSGQLLSGESFAGPAELKAILLKHKRDEFLRCLSSKMLTYALGRGLERYDKCALDEIVRGLSKNKYRFSSLVMEVAKSTPFQMRRGEEKKR